MFAFSGLCISKYIFYSTLLETSGAYASSYSPELTTLENIFLGFFSWLFFFFFLFDTSAASYHITDLLIYKVADFAVCFFFLMC